MARIQPGGVATDSGIDLGLSAESPADSAAKWSVRGAAPASAGQCWRRRARCRPAPLRRSPNAQIPEDVKEQRTPCCSDGG